MLHPASDKEINHCTRKERRPTTQAEKIPMPKIALMEAGGYTVSNLYFQIIVTEKDRTGTMQRYGDGLRRACIRRGSSTIIDTASFISNKQYKEILTHAG